MAAVAIVLEHRFLRIVNGTVWTDSAFAYPFWKRYLTEFEEVIVVARVRNVSALPAGALRVCGYGVRVEEIPYYVGPFKFVLKSHLVRHSIRRALTNHVSVILRVPGNLGHIAYKELRRHGRSYGVEVVGDPYEVFSRGASLHPLRAIFRWIFAYRLKEICKNASAAAYVTKRKLQLRYPPGSQITPFNYTSADLPYEAYVAGPRKVFQKDKYVLITVGSLEQPYKGVDTIIRAVRICKDMGQSLYLRIVGDGRYKSDLEALTRQLGLNGAIFFLGRLPSGIRIREELDRADLFVLASRTEGLPRALIEAMARGLPCIGTCVGGIPELLNETELVPPNDPEALAQAIISLIHDSERMTRISKENLRKSREYANDVLQKRRDLFLAEVKRATEDWLRLKEVCYD